MRRTTRWILVIGLFCLGIPVDAAQWSGTVSFVDRSGKPLTDAADPRNTVIYFEPRAVSSRPTPTAAEMVTRGKEFVPTVLPVLRGSTVKFPNFDPILHNVFSVSGENRFDLGLYSKGPGKPYTFKSPGVVRVFCNVHHSMVGYVLVLDTPYFTTATGAGAFTLSGLPDSTGKLTLWHPQIEPFVVELRAGSPLPPLRLTVTKERVPSHLNKLGKEYSRDRRDRYDR